MSATGPETVDREAPRPAPPWRVALAAALHRGRAAPESRYVQLATAGRDGGARCRTVVFRGFGPDSEILILTDRRSGKCAEIERQPRAEICWYLPKTREQFRLSILADLYGDESAAPWAPLRHRLWQERGARGQAEWLGAIPDAPLPLPVPEFILLTCTVTAAEQLELRPTPQRRTGYRLVDGVWSIVAPQ